MYSNQKAFGLNPYGSEIARLIKAFPGTLEKEGAKSKRHSLKDQGKNTLNDGYTKQEMKKLVAIS
ncbi:hypothetical protein RMATCC62417_12546 [Rhizopus microsporus]|nr:hypothetical protein RMATCC62417_12546 [Rhizopus microsporus]